MIRLKSFFIPGYRAIYLISAASIVGTLLFATGNEWLYRILTDRWTLQYLLLSPFMHAGLIHMILNIMGLHFIGGQMLLRLIGEKWFLLLFVVSALAGILFNNFLSGTPAIGISAAVLGMLSCALYPYGRAPMKILFIHDVLRLPPFPLYGVAAFIVMLDIAGVLLDWGFFAHWAHLGGFAAGGVVGWFIFRRARRRRVVVTLH